MALRKTTQEEKEVFEYLNDLRESGETNMFGASPYIQEHFGMDSYEARKYLSLWMKVFNKEGIYEQIDVP